MNELQEIEFSVDSSFVERLPSILSNIEQLKEWAIEATKNDKDVVVTNDNKKEVEAHCTELNRFITILDDKRKEIKKAYTKPLDIFEKAIKEVTTILFEARIAQWEQCKHIDAQKEEGIREVYRREWNDMNEKVCLSFEQVFNDKWLSKKKDEVINLLKNEKSKMEQETQIIMNLRSPYTLALLAEYYNGSTLSEVIYLDRKIKDLAKEFTVAEDEFEKECAEPSESECLIDIRVVANKEQLQDLKSYLFDKKIKFGRVPTKGE